MTRLNQSTYSALLLAAALGLLGAACDEEPSGKIPTSGISASIVVRADGSGSTLVKTSLTTGNPRADDDSDSFFPIPSNLDVRLTNRDRLFAKRLSSETVKGQSRKMKRDNAEVRPRYIRSFEGDEGGTSFRIAFSRKRDGNKTARESRVTLPASLELDWVDDPIALTPAPIPFSRSSSTPLFVVWNPFDAPDFEPGDELDYEITGSCIARETGALDWEAGDDVLQLTEILQDTWVDIEDSSCPIRVRLSLSRQGTVDSAFRGGRAVAIQTRELELDSIP